MKKVVLITGTSSGIGLQTALLLAKNNYTVYASMRNTGKKEPLQNEAKAQGVSINIMIQKTNCYMLAKLSFCVKE